MTSKANDAPFFVSAGQGVARLKQNENLINFDDCGNSHTSQLMVL